MSKLSFNCIIIIVLSVLLCSSGSGWGKSFGQEKEVKGQPTEKDREKNSSSQPQEDRERPLKGLQEESVKPGDTKREERTKNKDTKRKIKKTARLKSLSKSKKDLFSLNGTGNEELLDNPSGKDENSPSDLQATINNLFEDPQNRKIVDFHEEDDELFLPREPETTD